MAPLGHNELKYSSNFDCSSDSNTLPHQASHRVSIVNLPLCSDTPDMHQQPYFITNFMMNVETLYPEIVQAICIHRIHSRVVIVPQESYQGNLLPSKRLFEKSLVAGNPLASYCCWVWFLRAIMPNALEKNYCKILRVNSNLGAALPPVIHNHSRHWLGPVPCTVYHYLGLLLYI